MENEKMKIVVIGGTGLIGSKVVSKLNERGYNAVAASPNSGVNTLTGEGLDEVLAGASVVVDVSNSPSFEDKAVMDFFETSTRNLLKSEAAAGVGHHVALSVVGCDRLPDSGYLRAKVAQEKLIKESSIPYSIVRATQFFEFLARIADTATEGNTVRLPAAAFQPLAADDVAKVVARTAVGSPLNGTVEVAGPEQLRFDEFISRSLDGRNEPREIIVDAHARYFGTELSENSLVPIGDGALIGETRFADWLNGTVSQNPPSLRPAAVAAGDSR
ncbi:MAG TPA: SDR family oxidoreductase [Pyrinomonadaceae bacterium]|nr:SDR family oxidoreductase [Pyrinomonadaceae bacterium]